MKKLLYVSECFYSLQCEGREIGRPAVFLRLAGCNLLCQSDSWTCDTIEVWQKGVKTNFEDVLSADFMARLREGAHLVITGGEPLLHQEQVVDFIKFLFETYLLRPIVEIETNGTIIPGRELLYYTHLFNVSPKLSNSGMPAEKRINPNALAVLNQHHGSIFKFVVATEGDVLEMLNEYFPLINPRKAMLMPAGSTREELDAVRPVVVEQAKQLGLRYSERLHIVIWNKKTGV